MPKAVIASEAKQSSPLPALQDCFVASLLAMTPLTMGRHPRDLVLAPLRRLAAGRRRKPRRIAQAAVEI